MKTQPLRGEIEKVFELEKWVGTAQINELFRIAEAHAQARVREVVSDLRKVCQESEVITEPSKSIFLGNLNRIESRQVITAEEVLTHLIKTWEGPDTYAINRLDAELRRLDGKTG